MTVDQLVKATQKLWKFSEGRTVAGWYFGNDAITAYRNFIIEALNNDPELPMGIWMGFPWRPMIAQGIALVIK